MARTILSVTALAVLVLYQLPAHAGDEWESDKLLGGDASCQATSNWYVGVEAAFLKPHLGALSASFPAHTDVAITPTFDYEVSPRIWLAWDNAEGLGFRATYWQWDAGTSQALLPPGHPGPDIGIGVGLEAHTLDLEVTQRACAGQVQLQFAGGMRYGKMATDIYGFDLNDPADAYGLAADFEGIGPTIAVDLRRPVGSRGLSLIGGVRGAWLYGTTDATTNLLPITITAEDHMMQVWEVSMGVEWSRCLARGGQISAALQWEAQAWEWAPVVSLLHQDIGLTGPTFSLSYMR